MSKRNQSQGISLQQLRGMATPEVMAILADNDVVSPEKNPVLKHLTPEEGSRSQKQKGKERVKRILKEVTTVGKPNYQTNPEKTQTIKTLASTPAKPAGTTPVNANPFGKALYLARKHTGREISQELREAVNAIPRENQMGLIWALAPAVVRGESEPDGLFAIGHIIHRGQYPAMAVALRNTLRACPSIDVQTLMSLGVAEIRGEKGKERVSYSLSLPILRKFAEYLQNEGKTEPANSLMAVIRKSEEFLAIRAAAKNANTQPTQPPTE